MKRHISLIMVSLIVLMLVLGGCGASSANNNIPSQQAINETNNKAPDNADLIGEITEINDTAVTLKIIELPEPGGRGPRSEQEQPQGQQPSGQKPSEKPSPEQRTTEQQRSAQNAAGQQQPQQSALKYTGESKTITIPTDIAITKVTRGQNGAETSQLKLSDLKKGDVLQIWFSDTDKKVVSKISLR